MLVYRQPIGTAAYLGGLKVLLEDFSYSFLQMMLYSQEYACQPGQYVHLDRSKISARAGSRNVLASNMQGEFLFMSDSDHTFEPDLLVRLLAVFNQFKPGGERIDVLTGLYRYVVPPHLPVLYHFDEDTQSHVHIAEVDMSQPVFPVDCAGAGVLLIRRCVFERIAAELREKPFDEYPPFSEDFSFFMRCRKVGIKAYCAPQIQSHHLRVTPVTDDDYMRDEVMTTPMPNGGLAARGKMKGV